MLPMVSTFVKEVTPKFTVMDLYADKKSEVNQAITDYLNEKLTEEYGVHVSSALVIDVQLDEALQQKVQAKQDAEIAELEKQTAQAAGRIRQGYRVLARKDGEHYIIRVEEES